MTSKRAKQLRQARGSKRLRAERWRAANAAAPAPECAHLGIPLAGMTQDIRASFFKLPFGEIGDGKQDRAHKRDGADGDAKERQRHCGNESPKERRNREYA